MRQQMWPAEAPLDPVDPKMFLMSEVCTFDGAIQTRLSKNLGVVRHVFRRELAKNINYSAKGTEKATGKIVKYELSLVSYIGVAQDSCLVFAHRCVRE